MTATPLVIGPNEIAALHDLRERAAAEPVDMPPLVEALKTPDGKRAHMDRMNRLSVDLPFGFRVSFSIEMNHPGGTMRHMSMSSPVKGRIPHPDAVWMVCRELGFLGPDFEMCAVWEEELQRGPDFRTKAVNVVQPLAITDASAVKQ